MSTSVREYAILYVGKGGKGASSSIAGGNAILNAGQHALDGPEHTAAGDLTRLDATAAHHGLLAKLSGLIADALRGDGTFGQLDHGGLGGLGDDDHPQYTTVAALAAYAQPLDAELSALAALVSAADKLPYFTGSGSASLATLSAFIRTLLDDPDAATARATLGIGAGGTSASDTSIWRPVMDGAGAVVTDGATGDAIMAYAPA